MMHAEPGARGGWRRTALSGTDIRAGWTGGGWRFNWSEQHRKIV
jgi:hypothetical protein